MYLNYKYSQAFIYMLYIHINIIYIGVYISVGHNMGLFGDRVCQNSTKLLRFCL